MTTGWGEARRVPMEAAHPKPVRQMGKDHDSGSGAKVVNDGTAIPCPFSG